MVSTQAKSNTNGRPSPISVDKEDRIMTKLSEHSATAPIAHWLRYEASANICLHSVALALASGLKPERVLEELKGEARVMTLRAYGDYHPQMPISQTMDASAYRQALNDNLKQAA